MKTHWFERQNGFTRFTNRFNLGLVPARRTCCAELTCGVDQYWDSIGVLRCNPANTADKAAVVHIRTTVTDTDNAAGSANIKTCLCAQGYIPVACGVVRQRLVTEGGIFQATSVGIERISTGGRVFVAV